MKPRFVVSALLIVLAAGVGWSQFYQGLSAQERKELGEDYYLAGQQYAAIGNEAKGTAFMQMARNIWPDLDPAAIVERQQPSATELLARGTAPVFGVTDTQGAAARTISSFFLRFIGSLLDEEAAQAAGFLDGSVYLGKTRAVLSRAEAQDGLAALFEGVNLSGLAPSAIYDLDSVVIAAAPESLSQAWGETWILRVDAKTDFSAFLPFWETKQQYYIRLADDRRFIAAIGQSAPPAGWRPAPAPAPVPRKVASAAEDASAAVVDAFTGCVSAFLKKNADAAVAFLAPEVYLVRMGGNVTRDELKASFLGAFESSDFGGASFEDIVDAGTIFVEPTADFASTVSGDVRLLTAKARVDLSESIPYWTTWQGYYFRQDQGSWKIFAIR